MQNQDNNGLTRAEVSRMTGISERMLRYYESKRVDLLHPSEASYGQAGVRYNTKESMKAISIGNFLDMGFTISQIKELFREKKSNISELLDDQIDLLEKQIEEINLRIMCVRSSKFFIRYSKFLSPKDLLYSDKITRTVFETNRSIDFFYKLSNLQNDLDEELITPLTDLVREISDGETQIPYCSFVNAMNTTCDYFIQFLKTNDMRYIRTQIKTMILAYLDTAYDIDPDDATDKEYLTMLMNEIDEYFEHEYDKE